MFTVTFKLGTDEKALLGRYLDAIESKQQAEIERMAAQVFGLTEKLRRSGGALQDEVQKTGEM